MAVGQIRGICTYVGQTLHHFTWNLRNQQYPPLADSPLTSGIFGIICQTGILQKDANMSSVTSNLMQIPI